MVEIIVQDLNIWFGATQAIRNLSLQVAANRILTIIGPANSGKTTFLRTLNRLNEMEPGFRASGRAMLGNEDIMSIAPETLRRRVGMVFAMPLPLPLSIFDNVAYGPRLHGMTRKSVLEQVVTSALQSAYLWDEVKDRLKTSAYKLSGGQQQRLCIARTLAVEPEVILFDEPCSGLDPISTAKVEEAMLTLKERYTIVLVTNNVKQAARVGDNTAFFMAGGLVELDDTQKIFTAPSNALTDEYLRGKFG